MITLNIHIRNPFHNEALNPWKSLYQAEKLLTKHKALSVVFSKYSYTLFDFGLDTNCAGRDHAGPEFELSIFGYWFQIALNDTRHWDFENNTWEVYPDKE